MRRFFTVLLAVALLVGGGVTYMLLTTPDEASAQEGAAQTETAQPDTDDAPESDDAAEDADADTVRPGRTDLVGDVLDNLVADGVITQEQADQITAAFTARREELRAQFQANGGERGRRGHGFGHGFDLGGMLDDGVIDASELAELGEDHPLNDPDGPAAAYLDDGQLTQEELDALKAELGSELGRHGSPFGADRDDDTGATDDDTDATEGFFSG